MIWCSHSFLIKLPNIWHPKSVLLGTWKLIQRKIRSQSFFNKGNYTALLCNCTLPDWQVTLICVQRYNNVSARLAELFGDLLLRLSCGTAGCVVCSTLLARLSHSEALPANIKIVTHGIDLKNEWKYSSPRHLMSWL